jgi:hypothetical protein
MFSSRMSITNPVPSLNKHYVTEITRYPFQITAYRSSWGFHFWSPVVPIQARHSIAVHCSRNSTKLYLSQRHYWRIHGWIPSRMAFVVTRLYVDAKRNFAVCFKGSSVSILVFLAVILRFSYCNRKHASGLCPKQMTRMDLQLPALDFVDSSGILKVICCPAQDFSFWVVAERVTSCEGQCVSLRTLGFYDSVRRLVLKSYST